MEPNNCCSGHERSGGWHLPRLLTIFADSAYVGAWHAWVDYIWEQGFGTMCRFVMQFVQRAPGTIGFKVLPRRWVVERTFVWFGKYRRLSKDYEYLPNPSPVKPLSIWLAFT